MANEIRISNNLTVNNGFFTGEWNAAFQADQSGLGGGNPGTVDLTTTEAAIDLGDIDSVGWCWMKNIGDTNVAEIGFTETFTGGILLQPGKTAGPFRLISGSSLRGRSITGPTSVQIIVLEA